jgi:uncharacterized protein
MSLARTIDVARGQHIIEARLTRPSTATGLVTIAPPHPVYGGTIGNPVVRALERAYGQRGFATLTFNFRGTGESSGEPSGEVADAVEDHRAVLASAPDLRLSALTGYSFGSVVALTTAIEVGVFHVLMVAPPLGMLDPTLLARFAGRLVVVAAEHDEYAPLSALRERLEGRATLAIVPGADHFFLGSMVGALSTVLEGELHTEVGGDS